MRVGTTPPGRIGIAVRGGTGSCVGGCERARGRAGAGPDRHRDRSDAALLHEKTPVGPSDAQKPVRPRTTPAAATVGPAATAYRAVGSRARV